MCNWLWRRGERRATIQCEYRYPSSRIIWKNSMQVVHTEAEPPNHGRIILPIIG